MKLALIGTGKMGRLVAEMARAQGVEVVARFASDAPLASASEDDLCGATVGVDFSVGEAVPATVRAACGLGLDLVIGTTGWHERESELRSLVAGSDLGVVHASNFSLGVHLFYGVVERAAKIFAAFADYDPFLQEAHHQWKRDSPSGTALALRRRLQDAYGRDAEIPTISLRAGHIPGTHVVGFDSEADTVLLEHRARGRQGFATGALMAAHWIERRSIGGRSGWFTFSDVLDDLCDDSAARAVAHSTGSNE